MSEWDKYKVISDMDRQRFEKEYMVSFDPANGDDRTHITRREVGLPNVCASVNVSSELFKQSPDIDYTDHVLNQCKHEIVSGIVDRLIELDLVRIVNQTEMILEKQKKFGFVTDNEQTILNEYYQNGQVTITGHLDVYTETNGYSYNDFNSPEKLNPDRTREIGSVDADFIWKLLPPRINGIDDTKHPLQPGWMGKLPRVKDTIIIEKVRRILNK